MWRDRLWTTIVNRRLIGSALILLTAQLLLVILCYVMGLPLTVQQTMMLFLYFVILGMMAITVDKVLAASAITFGTAAIIAAFHPSIRMFLLSAADAVFTLNVFYGWHREATDAKTE